MTVQEMPSLIRSIPLLEPEVRYEKPTFIKMKPTRVKRPRKPAEKKVNPAGYNKSLNCRAGHPLTEDNIYLMKNGGRRCRTCQKLRSLESYRRRTK